MFSSKIQLFPNPAQNYFIIQLNDNSFDAFQLDIFDLMGVKAFSHHYTNNGNVLVPIALSSGMYMVHIKGNNQRDYFSKIVIR